MGCYKRFIVLILTLLFTYNVDAVNVRWRMPQMNVTSRARINHMSKKYGNAFYRMWGPEVLLIVSYTSDGIVAYGHEKGERLIHKDTSIFNDLSQEWDWDEDFFNRVNWVLDTFDFFGYVVYKDGVKYMRYQPVVFEDPWSEFVEDEVPELTKLVLNDAQNVFKQIEPEYPSKIRHIYRYVQ